MPSFGESVDRVLASRAWNIVAVAALAFLGLNAATYFSYSTPLLFITLLVPVATWGIGYAYGQRKVYRKVGRARSERD